MEYYVSKISVMGQEKPRRSPATALVREALRAYAQKPTVSRIVARSLHLAGCVSIPVGGTALRNFVTSHLLVAVTEILGEATSTAVRGMLMPLAQQVPSLMPLNDGESGTRMKFEMPDANRHKATGERIAEWSQLIASEQTTILIAGTDALRVAALEELLPGLRLAMVHDVVGLLDIVHESPNLLPIIVLDCQAPSFHISTLATVAPELNPDSRFLLWGVTENDDVFGDQTAEWIRCEERMPMVDVAGAILRLMP